MKRIFLLFGSVFISMLLIFSSVSVCAAYDNEGDFDGDGAVDLQYDLYGDGYLAEEFDEDGEGYDDYIDNVQNDPEDENEDEVSHSIFDDAYEVDSSESDASEELTDSEKKQETKTNIFGDFETDSSKTKDAESSDIENNNSSEETTQDKKGSIFDTNDNEEKAVSEIDDTEPETPTKAETKQGLSIIKSIVIFLTGAVFGIIIFLLIVFLSGFGIYNIKRSNGIQKDIELIEKITENLQKEVDKISKHYENKQ